MKNRYWGEWAAQNGYDACIIRNSLDYLSGNTPGKKPGTVIMTFNSANFKSKYNTGKLGKTNPDIRYHKAGTFALTGEPISQQMQDITKRLAAGQAVDLETIMATPEVQWAEANQLKGESLPYDAESWSHAEYAERIGPERASLQADVLDELMDRGSAVLDSNGKVQYTGPIKQEKRLDVVIGPPAAGKSSALVDPISQKFGSRVLDSDDVKARLPEFDGGLNSGYLHNESRLVWNRMQKDAINAGDNVVLPIVGGKQSSVEKTIQPYIDAGYSINLHYMELDRSKAIGRGLNRFLSNGRYITPEYLFSVNNGGVEATYEAMKNGGSIDGYSKWNNDVPFGQHPRFIEGSALQGLYERGPVGVERPGDGSTGSGKGQGMGGGQESQTGAGDNQSQVRKTLKYSKNTPQQTLQGVSSIPKGSPKSSPAKIAKGLVKTLGLGEAIGTKRMNRVPQAVQGYYETRAKYIAVRSNQAGNYTVTMHEVFHNLAERLNMTGTQDMVNNLDPVFAASYDPVELPGEAFAEFGWRYMENESLARQFAGDAFVDQFEARLRQAGLHKPVHDAARQLRIWLNATVNERIGATIVDKSRAAKPGSLREQFRTLISQYQEAYDLTHKGGAIAEAKTFLSEGYDRIDEINANDSLSPEQKYTLTSDVRREMIEVALEANEAAAAYNEKYVAGLNIATNALYEGAYLSIPTAMDRLDQTFKADSDQTYMQQATSVWEATGDDSALPHPNTSYTVSGVTYTVSEEDMDNWLLQYKIGYQEYLVEKGKHWDSLTDEEKLEILKNAHSAGHNTAKSWHMKLHGIK